MQFGGARALLALAARTQTDITFRVLTHMGRVALLAAALGGLFFAEVTSISYSAAGLRLLKAIVWTDGIFITIAAVIYLAPSIAEENDDGTMPLLRMTRLSPVAILLGKAGARALELALLILLQVPITFIAITLGGVSIGQVIACYAALLAYLIFLTGMIIFFSTISSRPSVALTWTVVALLIYHFAIPFMGHIFDDPSFMEKIYFALSPFTCFRFITDTGYNYATTWLGEETLPQLITDTILGLAFFSLSLMVFSRVIRERKEAAPPRILFAHKGRRSSFSPGNIWKLPLMWKDFNFMAGGKPIFVFKLILYIVLGWYVFPCFILGTANPFDALRRSDFASYGMVAMTLILGTELLYCASQVYCDEIRWGTLSTLATTPLSSLSIMFQKMAGIVIGAIPSFIVWLPLAIMTYAQGSTSDRRVFIYLLCHALFILTAVLLLSLYMKRGSVPLALIVFGLGGWLLRALIAKLIDEYTGHDIWSLAIRFDEILMLFVTVLMLRWSVRRFKVVAAE